ncbi:MAG TPA: putative quinol monooxygenase [Solirubrobacterales bacterium]|nr:putative quinol monooxygenase [Solirubrobacterales bacterium]
MAYVVIARWTAREGEEGAVAAALGEMIEPSRAEPGNLAYQVHRDPENPRRFVIYERYVDEAAYAAHAASDHFQRHAVGDALDRLASREREFLAAWDGEGAG